MQLTRTKRAKLSAIFALGGATVIVACSSESSVSEVGFGGASSGAVGGSASAPTTDRGPDIPRCPADAPAAGEPCPTSDGAICGYGPDTREECAEQRFVCTAGRWKDIAQECEVRCPENHADIVPGGACGDIDMACSYDEGTCGCTGDRPAESPDAGLDAGTDAESGAGEGGSPPKVLYPGVWKCVAPPATAACPSARPRVLDACVKDVTCDYGTCELGRPLGYACMARIWVASFDPPGCDE